MSFIAISDGRLCFCLHPYLLYLMMVGLFFVLCAASPLPSFSRLFRYLSTLHTHVVAVVSTIFRRMCVFYTAIHLLSSPRSLRLPSSSSSSLSFFTIDYCTSVSTSVCLCLRTSNAPPPASVLLLSLFVCQLFRSLWLAMLSLVPLLLLLLSLSLCCRSGCGCCFLLFSNRRCLSLALCCVLCVLLLSSVAVPRGDRSLPSVFCGRRTNESSCCCC